RLDFIVVDDGGELGKLVLAGAQGRLPYRSLINLAVTHDHEDARVAALDAGGERHAETIGKPVAERTRRSLNARNLVCFRMTPEDRIAVAEGVQRLDRDEALVGEKRVEREAAMAFAQYNAVAIAPFWLPRPATPHVVIEHAQNLDWRHR